MTKFKEGQWLIRRWSKECGGETDFVRFKEQVDEKKFTYTKFYRIKKRKVISINRKHKSDITTYIDNRMSLQYRPATKSEIQKYSEIIMNQPHAKH